MKFTQENRVDGHVPIRIETIEKVLSELHSNMGWKILDNIDLDARYLYWGIGNFLKYTSPFSRNISIPIHEEYRRKVYEPHRRK